MAQPQFIVSTEALNALFHSPILRSGITIYHTSLLWKRCDKPPVAWQYMNILISNDQRLFDYKMEKKK